MKKKQNEADKLEFICSEDPRQLIKAGQYHTQIVKIEQKPFKGKEMRLYLHHKIVFGEHMGLVLFQSINSKYERFGLGTKFYKQWKRANYNRAPRKGQKMSLETFLNKVFLVEVRSVNSDERYSVVDIILQVLAPDEPQKGDTK